jgi:hypothetical protein
MSFARKRSFAATSIKIALRLDPTLHGADTYGWQAEPSNDKLCADGRVSDFPNCLLPNHLCHASRIADISTNDFGNVTE